MSGPSADGTSGPTLILSALSAPREDPARNATQVPSVAIWVILLTCSSAAISSGVARRRSLFSSSADKVMWASAASGSTRWSNWATNTWSRGRESLIGASDWTVGAGVTNSQLTDLARAPPLTDWVPAATSTR